MVERCIGKREGFQIGLPEPRQGQARRPDARLGLTERRGGEVHAGDPRARAAQDQRYGLGADAAACLQHGAACGIGGVVMQQRFERRRLIMQALAFRLVVAVDIA